MMQTSFLLSALLSAIFASAAPAPYIVTSYVELEVYTMEGYTGVSTTQVESLVTFTHNVVPTASPVTDAISTYTDSLYYDDRVTILEIAIPPGSGKTVDAYQRASTTGDSTSYVIPITYTPSAKCSGQNWTYVTNVPFTVPTIVRNQVSAVTVSPSVTTSTNYYNERLTSTTVMVAFLDPSAVAVTDYEEASSYAQPYGLSSCYTPTTTCMTYSSKATCIPTFSYDYGYTDSGSDDDDNTYSGYTPYSGYYSSCRYYGYSYDSCWYRNVIIIAVCVPVGWILLWALLGLWESWLSFKGLMLGQQRKRGMPYSFCCISIWFLCCVGPTFKAKSAEEQAVMLERWNAMKAGEKFKLWLKWGFRWKYPDVLGESPGEEKQALRRRCL